MRVWFSSAGDILQSDVKEYTHFELSLGPHLANKDPMGAMMLKLNWLPQNYAEVEFLHFGYRKPLTGLTVLSPKPSTYPVLVAGQDPSTSFKQPSKAKKLMPGAYINNSSVLLLDEHGLRSLHRNTSGLLGNALTVISFCSVSATD